MAVARKIERRPEPARFQRFPTRSPARLSTTAQAVFLDRDVQTQLDQVDRRKAEAEHFRAERLRPLAIDPDSVT